jgi:hypothetical protein
MILRGCDLKPWLTPKSGKSAVYDGVCCRYTLSFGRTVDQARIVFRLRIRAGQQRFTTKRAISVRHLVHVLQWPSTNQRQRAVPAQQTVYDSWPGWS